MHLLYDGFLDLGEIPLPEEINCHDEVVELNTPPIPGLDYLAGSEHSWWRRAFRNALDELMNPKKAEAYEQAGGVDKKTSTQKQQLEPDEIHKHDDLNETLNNDIDTYLGWRLGPAKYWYDQLGLPLDINISEWTEWRRPLTSTTTTACSINNNNDSNSLSLHSSTNSEYEAHDCGNLDTNKLVNETVSEVPTFSTIKKENIDESFHRGYSDQVCSKQDPDSCQQRLSTESLFHSSPALRKCPIAN
ncbi:unnamed protein product [Schistosoma mattheei]|uniref:Uncharacterized protein n=1 Tax=Schistosoma mattheei TaxID=31246 RepID=A0A3P7YJQ5_9TREM|nr:unnamed protein product [Schistosoma mattheei]